MMNMMKCLKTTGIALVTGFAVNPVAATAAGSEQSPLRLWYDKPAAKWEEALPVGNGRLGAMVFGGRLRNGCN